MPVISPATIQRVRAASDIVDVIGGYIPLKKAGASFTALCPFHKEKTPSFHVNPQRQIFHCFGCNKGGDVFAFVREYESLDFVEAVRRLAERARIELDYEQGSPDAPARHIKERLFEIHEQIAQRWETALANDAAGQIARDYLARRGVSAEAVQLFRLGYAPESWDDTVNWALSRKYDMALIEQAGLAIRHESGRYYDRFRGRLMFPICDEQGRVAGFSGRILSGDEKAAKYVNSPETAIFTKSKIFFGLDKSKRAILDEGRAVVCEGQLDLIACYMSGVKNIVAPQGTAFTADHARIIKRYVNEVILCFDSDAAGQNAAVRSLDHLLASGLAVRVAVVPEPHDPDSFIKENGGAEFKALLDKAEGFFDFYLGRLCAQNDVSTDRGRLALLQSMADALHKADNQVLLDTYARKTALRLGVLPDAVLREFKKRAGRTWVKQPEAAEPSETATASAPRQAPSTHETWLLRILVNEPDVFCDLARFLDPAWIQHLAIRDIVQKRLEILRDGTWEGLPGFMDLLGSDEQRQMVSQAGVLAKPVPNPDVQLKDIFLKLRNQAIDRYLASVRQRAALPETPEEERIELLRKLVELRQSRSAPLAELP